LIKSIDHVVLNVNDIARAVGFYKKLGFEIADEFAWKSGKIHCPAIKVGERQKINIHASNTPAEPKAAETIVGSADLCFVWDGGVEDLMEYLKRREVTPELGPVPRRGALGQGISVYVRDLDGNLLEFLTYCLG